MVKNRSFRCAVSTAPEGLFKGYSTLVITFDGEWGAQTNLEVVAKAVLRPGMSTRQWTQFHTAVLQDLDALGSDGTDLAGAIDSVFAKAEEGGLIVGSLNGAHSMATDSSEHSGFSDLGSDVQKAIEANGRAVANEADRLMSIINDVANRIGKAPISYNDAGDVLLHPDLAQELRKPGNEELIDMLRLGFQRPAGD